LAREHHHSPRPRGLAARLAWGFDRLVDAGAALAAILLIAVMLMTTVKVVFRYGLHQGLIGVDQLSGTLLLYITFLGAAWLLRRDEHVQIDLLIGVLPERVRRGLFVASSLAGALICLTLAVYGGIEAVTSWQRGIRIAAEIEIPRAVNLIVIPFGFACLSAQFLRRAWRGEGRRSPVEKVALE